jgi:hypothetical protein
MVIINYISKLISEEVSELSAVELVETIRLNDGGKPLSLNQLSEKLKMF